MLTLISGRAGTVGRWWRAVVLNHVVLNPGQEDVHLPMWLVTVPAVALAVMSGPVIGISAMHPWINRLGTFVAMVTLATLYAVPVGVVSQRAAPRSRTSQILLSCWWIGAGAAVWMPAGWLAAVMGGAGAAVLLHLMVRQMDAMRLPT